MPDSAHFSVQGGFLTHFLTFHTTNIDKERTAIRCQPAPALTLFSPFGQVNHNTANELKHNRILCFKTYFSNTITH